MSQFRITPSVYGIVLSVILAACADADPPMSVAASSGASATDPVELERVPPDRRVSGRYIVRFSEGDDGRARARDIASRLGGTIRHVYSWRPGFSIELPDTTDALTGLLAEDGLHRVKEVQRLTLVGAASFTPTEQTSAPYQLDRIDQQTGTDGDYHWSEPSPSASRIYVVDTGVRGSHDEFNSRVTSGHSVMSSPYHNADEDCHGHGTAVASIAAGETYGSAKGATIIPVRIDDCNGDPDEDDFEAGLQWVLDEDEPWSIVNLSVIWEDGSNDLDDLVNQLIDDLYVVVAGAGNYDDDACDHSPGGLDEVITVGSVTKSDARRSDSSFGSCVDVWAPGDSLPAAGKDSDSDTALFFGTSAATPVVSGIAYAMQTEQLSGPATVMEVIVGVPLSGAPGSAISGELTGLGTGSPNLLIYGPRSYARIIGTRSITVATSYTWSARAYGGDDSEFDFEWEKSTNGTSWTTVSTTASYQESIGDDQEYTFYLRLTVESEFGDEREHEIEIDVDTPCVGQMCVG